MLSFESLTAVSVDQTGSTRDLESTPTDHTMVVVTTGTSVSGSVDLEGSHDGSNFATLGTITLTANTTKIVSAHHAVRYVRARLRNLAGTSPVVTATIASF